MPEYAAGLAARLYTALVSAAARGSAHVITLSEATKTDIVHYLKLPEESITPTYLACDDHFHPRLGAEHDEDIRQKYGLPEQFILYLGGFDRRKRVDQLLLAYTFVTQAEGDAIPLVIAGKEPQWGTSIFPDMRNITDMVQWIGYVDEVDKPALYRLAEVFVWPSLYEGFGLPMLEAMACGTPVVAHEIAVNSEIAGDGAFLVENARGMAGAILALIAQQPLREAMINQGLARATHFSWRKTARETLAIYEHVMGM
jgi:glycosyltransferase involved in cell wall biosynthesis